jgi:hypothetical protein
MLFSPLTLSSIAGVVARSRADVAAPEWLPLAQKVAGGIALYSLIFPFWFQNIIARNSEALRARGKDPGDTLLLVTSAMATMPSNFAFFLCIAGGPARHVYYASALSFVVALYWIWRYRHVYTELNI